MQLSNIELTGGGGPDAELVFFVADLKTRAAALNDETRDAFVTGARVGICKHQKDTGLRSVRNPQLPAGQRKSSIRLHGAGLQSESIRS